MKGAKGMKKEGSFDVEEWKQELNKAAEGDYYHPDGDDLVPSLLNDVNTLEVDAIGAIMNLPSDIYNVYDAADEVRETTMNAAVVAANGVGKVQKATETAFRDGGDDIIDKVVDAATAATETTADVAGDVVRTVTEFALYECAEEVAEEVMDLFPVYGMFMGAWRLAWGSAYTAVGAASVAVGATVGTVGTVAGAAASPWDGGRLLKDSLKVAKSSAGWGGSVMGQGAFGFVKGTCDVVGQVPGTQVVTMPVGFVAKKASKACKNARHAWMAYQ